MHSLKAGSAGAAIAAALVGCQSYTPRPLDIDGHRAAWEARMPTDEGVAAFARRLATESGEPASFDVGDGLSLGEGEAVALLFNPDLRVARLRAGVARASADHAGRWEDPGLEVNAEKIIESVPDPWVLGASLSLTLPVSGRLAAERARSKAEHRAHLFSVEAVEWEVRIALRIAWLEWSASALRAELLGGLIGRLDEIVEIAGRLEFAGEVNRAEARLLRIERASRVGMLRSLRSRLREQELALKALMGLAPHADVHLVPAALGALAPAIAPRSDAAHRNPHLSTLRAEYVTAEESLRLEVRKQFPDLTVGPGLGTEDGDTRVLLGVSLPIPLWNRNRGGIAEATSRRDLARGAFEAALERVLGGLAAAEIQYQSARDQRDFLEQEIVPLIEEQDAEAQRIAALGEVETLLLLENMGRLYETKTALIDARLAEAIAAVRLEAIIGPPGIPAEDTEGDAK